VDPSSGDSAAFRSAHDVRFAELLAAARSGSGEATGELIEMCRPYLMLVANKELDPNLRAKLGASDIVQETLLTAQCKIPEFVGHNEGELLAWLRGILVNDLHDAHRRYRGTAKRQVKREVSLAGDSRQLGPVAEVTGRDRTPGTEAMAAEEAQALRQAMRRLPKEYVMVLRLRNWRQLSFAEIGQRMGRSTEAVRKLWSRAIARLQQELGTEEDKTGPAAVNPPCP
jgi:RNA polymerase sigma-70 factor (ECF subfamily)